MHLRLSRFVGLAPERADEMVIAFEEGDYLDRLAEAPGFDGYLLAADRGRGKITAMSFWQSAEDLAASDRDRRSGPGAQDRRGPARREGRSSTATRSSSTRTSSSSRATCASRGSPTSPPRRWRRWSTTFEGSDYVDELASLPGFSGYLLAADREHGKVLAMSLWESQDALRASDQAAEEARERRLAVAGAHDPIVDRYQIMLER